jgi:hypothetical protein
MVIFSPIKSIALYLKTSKNISILILFSYVTSVVYSVLNSNEKKTNKKNVKIQLLS